MYIINMWIIIRFDRLNDVQSNQAVFSNEVELTNFINTALETYMSAKMVMVPALENRINKKMYPIVTSDKCDFYAQWFDYNI
jgi:hypothetical protein